MNTGMSSENSKLCGTETFVVGLAPCYWAHVPMTVSDVKALRLVEGSYCALVPEKEVSPFKLRNAKFVPIQKCCLVGFIVNVTVKSNGSVLYVLDDGTGLIDCIDWNYQGNHDESLLLLGDNGNFKSCNHYEVGDLVSVLGRIQCKALYGPRELIQVERKKLTVRQSILDIHVTSIDHATLETEARHWISCCNSAIATTSSIGSARSQQRRLNNANDFLSLLGPNAQCQVQNQHNLPTSDDKRAAWRVFGPSCRCSLPYMESLLYCHCQAKAEPLDPNLSFRDAVLAVLLEMERSAGPLRLTFKYKDIICNERLAQMATQVVAGIPANPFLSANRLFLSTFQALRNDGILYLEDPDSDVYLLLSRSRVLEPYVKDEMKLGGSTSPKKELKGTMCTIFLSKVHHERLQYIRRDLSETTC